jgi:predicted RNase H-like nuclease (RuvC/YqgF family)
LRLSKFANWFKNTDPEKEKEQEQERQPVEPQERQNPLELEKLNSENQILSDRLQQAQKQVAQLQAQLQINQGFRIELGETQAKLQIAQAEVQRYKKQLFEGQKQLNLIQSQLAQTQETLAKFQNWEQQLKTPVQIVDINKTLPKENFVILWGF